MGIPSQECQSGLLLPSPGDLPYPGIQPESPALADRFFTTEPPEKPTQTPYRVVYFLFRKPQKITKKTITFKLKYKGSVDFILRTPGEAAILIFA